MTSPVTADRFTLHDVLVQHDRHRPGALALVCGNARLTWSELDRRVSALTAALRRDGVRTGDRILWAGQNCHRLMEALFAAARLGAVLCPVNWRQSAGELAFVIADSDPRVVLWQETEIGAVVAEARATASGEARWVQHDGDGADGYEQYVSGAGEIGELGVADPNMPLLMLYTAAFGGRPNGALLSHRALLAQSTTLRLLEGVSATDVYLNSGPLFHIGSFRRTVAIAHAGGLNVMVRRVDAQELCRLVHEERCTGAFLQSPTMTQMVEANADGRFDLSSLRTPGGPDGWARMVGATEEPAVRSGYGQTELAGVVTFTSSAEPSIGSRPGPLAQVEIMAPSGVPVEPGGTGEIVVRGPMVMNGYHRRPELNAQRQRDGWYHTHDLGRRERDGSITFVGPAEKMIKSAAENIYPVEVERCLLEHPGVGQAAVLGVPDETWGQRVKAVVVPAAGWSVTAEDLTDHCRATLAGYKRPRLFEFVPALPTSNGRLNRDLLDERFGGGGYPGTR